MTPRSYASMVVVCSEFVVVPNERCVTVNGPSDATVKFTDFGTYLEARRFVVDWSDSDGYEGDVVIGLNQYVFGYRSILPALWRITETHMSATLQDGPPVRASSVVWPLPGRGSGLHQGGADG